MSDSLKMKDEALSAPRILVMGVGSSGCRAVAGLSADASGFSVAAVDTDSKVLSGMDPEHFIHIGDDVTHGFSAGGAVELGRQAVEKDSVGIRKMLRDVDLLILVAGLGGGTGSGALPVITRIAREAGCLIMAMVSLPFDFEGKMKRSVADEALKRVRTHADALIRVSNKRLVRRNDAEIPAEEAFSRSHQVICKASELLCKSLSRAGVCSLDFAAIHTMLRNCDGYCNLALGQAQGEKRAELLAEALLKHPLLGNVEPWSSAEGVVVALSGGTDTTMNEIQTVMDRILEKLPSEVWFNYGVMVDAECKDELSAVVLMAEHWKEPLVDSAGRQIVSDRNGQAEFTLEVIGKGEFDQAEPTIYNHQNLDIPTFVRRDIKLPR